MYNKQENTKVLEIDGEKFYKGNKVALKLNTNNAQEIIGYIRDFNIEKSFLKPKRYTIILDIIHFNENVGYECTNISIDTINLKNIEKIPIYSLIYFNNTCKKQGVTNEYCI